MRSLKNVAYILLICFSLSFVVKAGSFRMCSKMGKQIEKNLSDNNEKDTTETEDSLSDNLDFEIEEESPLIPDFAVQDANTILKKNVHYTDVHTQFENTLLRSIFAPPPNLV